ncbi:hypothetical protein L5515_003098 [Caenorhabditis briggsae]|uniref:Domain of unknown function WSN domain-containing protein n=1 Tax=Caenorhabditis briggsae TaxID=6238 RepID=A0AAE9EI97_CAEBR|nr:hypothetical protein L5515_003098 [Caenorhabditis briggsae]
MIYDFWSVIVVLSIISKSYSTNFGSNSYNANKTENRFLDDDHPATSLDVSFVRNSIGNSPTPEVIEYLALLARIVTAITIPIGLSDGSIPEDNLIAELFNIEPGDVRILEKYDKQYSELLFIKISDIKPSNEVTKVYDGLAKMFEFMELWKSVNVSNLPDDVSFGKLGNLKWIDVSGMKDLNISDIRSVLQTLEVEKLKSSLQPLVTAVESIMVSPDEYLPTLEALQPLSALGRALNLYTFISEVEYNDMLPDILLYHLLSMPLLDLFYLDSCIDEPKLPTLLVSLNKWVQGIVQRDLSSLKEFERLGMEVIQLNGHWKSVSTYSTYTSLKLISDLCKLIAREPPSPDEVLSVMNGITSCSLSLWPLTVAQINQLAGYADILLKKLSAIKRMRESMRIINLKILPRLSKKISEEELKEMKKFWRNLKLMLGFAMRIFKREHKTRTKSFDCIRDLGDGFEKVASAARALMKIDQVQKNHTIMKDVQNTYETSSNTAKSLELIRVVLRNIKTYTDPELTNLTDLKNVSKPFGEAVAALVLSDAVSRRSSDFETFVNDGYSIENQVDNDRSDKFKNEFRAEWGNFRTTAHDINSMFVGITSWMETIKGPNASLSVEEVGLLYENLTDFVDVDLMTLQRLNAIYRAENEQSVTIDKKLLEEFKKSLLDLSKLDLKFARFQNSTIQMPETLDLLLNILYGEVIEPFTEKPLHDRLMTYPFLFGFLTMVFFSICSVRSSYRNVKKSYKNDIQRRNDKKVDSDESEDDELSEFEYDYEEIMDKYEEMPESVHEDHEQITNFMHFMVMIKILKNLLVHQLTDILTSSREPHDSQDFEKVPRLFQTLTHSSWLWQNCQSAWLSSIQQSWLAQPSTATLRRTTTILAS